MFRSTLLALAFAGPTACAMSLDDYGSASPRATTGELEGQVQLKWGRRRMRDHSGVVVVLEGVPEEPPDATAEVLEIRQIDKQFVPDVAVVLKGSTVTFPNDDHIDHNVYSNSKAAEFDLGQYKAGTTKDVTVRRTGEVSVFCNIHADMAARILVVDTEYYAMTDREGRFSIQGIPPGTYRYRAWQAWGPESRGRVRIRAGESTPLSLTLKRRKKPRGGNKDGPVRGVYPHE